MSDAQRGRDPDDPWPVGETADRQDDPWQAGETADRQDDPWQAGETADRQDDPWQAGETADRLCDPWPVGETADELDDPGAAVDIDELEGDGRPPMTWHGLPARQRWSWFDRLWSEVCVLRHRYRLAIRSEWWADELQVEVLAAFAAWVQRYDSGEWDDPPGKLALLFDIERVAAALRDGVEPFDPERDRPAFERHLRMLGCRPPTELGDSHP